MVNLQIYFCKLKVPILANGKKMEMANGGVNGAEIWDQAILEECTWGICDHVVPKDILGSLESLVS